MKSLWLAAISVFFLLPASGQQQIKMVPVASDVTIDLPNFSINAPSGEGWLVTDPDADTEGLRFQNSALKAAITVDDGKMGSPVPNVEEKLTQLAQATEKRFAEHGKVVLSEHVIAARPGAQCLNQTIIISSPELGPGNMAVHALACIYGADHKGIANFRYMYPTQGTADEQKKLIAEFFDGISFKTSPK